MFARGIGLLPPVSAVVFVTKSCLLALLVGASLNHGAAQQPNGPPPIQSADEMFRQLDANQDDKLTLDEGGPGVRQFTKRLFDMTGKSPSDSIGLEEFRQIVERHRRQSGRATNPDNAPSRPSPNRAPEPDSTRTPAVAPADRSASRRSTNPSRGQSPTTSNPALQQRLAGAWRGWVVDGRGENPNAGHMELELRVESNRIVGRELGTSRVPAGGLGGGTFVIAGEADSGTLDATATSGQHVGREYPGIYRLDGTTLHWCVNNRNAERPNNFETGRGNYYLILRKQP